NKVRRTVSCLKIGLAVILRENGHFFIGARGDRRQAPRGLPLVLQNVRTSGFCGIANRRRPSEVAQEKYPSAMIVATVQSLCKMRRVSAKPSAVMPGRKLERVCNEARRLPFRHKPA